jgi:hypothetical protein
MVNRPKSDGRCIHCRERLIKATKDHVFPDSWYPMSTPSEVQRWTAPSCGRCNHDFGEMEKELFVRLAFCVDPQNVGASGLSKKAIRSFGIGASGLSEKERRHRVALRDKIRDEVRPYSSDDQAHVLPGMGPHPEVPAKLQFQIPIPANMLYLVSKKVVRGCEYWLANGRIIEPPYEIDVAFARELPQDVLQSFAPFGPVYLGPGFRIRRAGAIDDPGVAMYEIVVWASWTICAGVLPPPSTENLQS